MYHHGSRGAGRVVGIDNSEQQLATAKRLQREHGSRLPAYPRQCGMRPVPGCELRFRYFGMRRLSLSRSEEVAARGVAAATAGRETAHPCLLTLCVPAE